MPSKKPELPDDIVHLARIALAGRQQDVNLLIHRFTKKYQDIYPEMVKGLRELLQESPTRSTPLRKYTDIPVPVDSESRFQLLRVENNQLDHELVLSETIAAGLNQLISERKDVPTLLKAGLHPTKSVLFTGPPGVGKTMAAKWIAGILNRPLLVLDLAAVMSSYLGKTGNNVRHVLDYAKSIECVLLLDELDAIAKRRDDSGEIGELKRLVTVLLQEIDDWPPSGLLLAATNHPNLLDPAVWRRFELVLDFGMPEPAQIRFFVSDLLNSHIKDAGKWGHLFSMIWKGRSLSDIEREILSARRNAVVSKITLEQQLLSTLLNTQASLIHNEKVQFANCLIESGLISQRQASEITGLSRDTIRKYSKVEKTK